MGNEKVAVHGGDDGEPTIKAMVDEALEPAGADCGSASGETVIAAAK